MSGFEEIRTLIDMITVNGARALGLRDYGLEPGSRADLVLFDAPTESDAIRLMAPRRLVVARTEPATSFVTWKGREEPVDFMPSPDRGQPA
jgi:cytosine/adenosine deaminase-related metal-dependent hydrolase